MHCYNFIHFNIKFNQLNDNNVYDFDLNVSRCFNEDEVGCNWPLTSAGVDRSASALPESSAWPCPLTSAMTSLMVHTWPPPPVSFWDFPAYFSPFQRLQTADDRCCCCCSASVAFASELRDLTSLRSFCRSRFPFIQMSCSI